MHSLFVLVAASCCLPAGAEVIEGRGVRVTVTPAAETVELRDNGAWVPALASKGAVTRVSPGGECPVASIQSAARSIEGKGECESGAFRRTLSLTSDPQVIEVAVEFTPKRGSRLLAVEDRLPFAPGKNSRGLLDFVWSQNIKANKDHLVAHWGFKSPAAMFQQGRVFTALVPRVDLLTRESLKANPPALDLDVTSDDKPWLSYGAVISTPEGHSYFKRSGKGALEPVSGVIAYRYWIVASAEPEKLGYRRVVRMLWDRFGHAALKASPDLQQNVRKPELFLFEDWRKEAWGRYANEKYWEKDCGGTPCGALTSNRNIHGDWKNAPKQDAWFNHWFNNVRTAYGWYATGNPVMKQKAERILNLALSAPREGGAFATIYVNDDQKWTREDGWAGYANDYHAFCMSWTSWWMLRWAADLTPGRKDEILAFVRPYGDFLLKQQRQDGLIPSWYGEGLKPRAEFSDFNAETAGSALFLAELSQATGDKKYLQAAERAMSFVEREVLPRHRWFDFETFRSCARKPFSFYDNWTAQYPQNNLSTIQAAMAWLKLYELTRRPAHLELGTRVLDYLLLTQQVWNHPLFSPKLVGGMTTQNTDAEWSDARQAYVALLLFDYYTATGSLEYLERAVAAARSTFAVAPWENWAHTGFRDEQGSLTGIHWGTGSAMMSADRMYATLGDAFIDVKRGHGIGFDACTLDKVRVQGKTIAFDLIAPRSPRVVRIRFAGIDPGATYQLIRGGGKPAKVSGAELARNGYVVKQ